MMYRIHMGGVGARANVIALSPREWRVSDPDQREEDGRALMGFIALVEDQYEVTPLATPLMRISYPCLEDAVASLLPAVHERAAS